MDPITGIAIAGLAMNSCELLLRSNVHKMQNPEVAQAVKFGKAEYTLEDVALVHLAEIESLDLAKSNGPFVFYGMSMGGMVLAILASEHRAKLPLNSKFIFLVTSANTAELPAVPDALLQNWFSARPGDVDSFRRILEPFFSRSFVQANASKVNDYIKYRAMGQNQQSPKDFLRQLSALRKFDGQHYFSRVNPAEAIIISGADDYILGPDHHHQLVELMPGAQQVLIPSVGHMINLEMPEVFDQWP